MDEFNTSLFRRAVIFSVLFVVAMAAPVLCLGAVADGTPVYRAPSPAAEGLKTSGSCEHAIENADFRASFEWSNGSGHINPMEIRIGKSAAQIFETMPSKAPKCVAVCSLKSNRQLATSSYPTAIDMECQSAGFTGLGSPAALVFQSGGQSVLRFGSWVSGYRDATLAVASDRLGTSSQN